MNEDPLTQHMLADSRFQEDQARVNSRFERAIFGSEIDNEKGMKAKVDEMHTFLIQARGISGFFSGVRGTILTLIAIGSLIAWSKGWFK